LHEQVPNVNEKSMDCSKKELGKLMKEPIAQFPAKGVATVAGCPSSGKLTFSRLVPHALREKGFDCVVLAMDPYYKIRVASGSVPTCSRT
jgi:putative protein kinase ArgK-like GTPase of G3E family